MPEPSDLEYAFDALWDEYYPDIDLEVEYPAIPKRKYKYDYAHPQSKVLVEINGQVWHKGGHSSGRGLLRDYEKCNLAQMNGYCVFQLASEMITEKWIHAIANTIKKRSEKKWKLKN